MTGPDGDGPHAWWEVIEAEPPRRLVFRHGFANADGSPNPDLPVTTLKVTVEDTGAGRTRMSIESQFPDAEAMKQILAMGMEEGRHRRCGAGSRLHAPQNDTGRRAVRPFQP